jgi:hypothetical protein
MRYILVDTSFLVSVYDKREPRHKQCVQVHDETLGQLVTCEAVVMEALHLLSRVHGAGDAILESVQRKILTVPFSLSDSISAVAELMRKYHDTPADFADACLIQMAEELGTGDILTLDSDFKHYRWRRNRSFSLLVPLD